ncbi:MAG: hypothetical protein JW818_06275 [Pirellulales bacterium]|nr:hypothetical protein [Pirellulales bacterium]
MAKSEEELIGEYEQLKRRLHELNVQTEHIDRRLVQIERQLPDHFTLPGDPPLDDAPERPTWPDVRWDEAD